PRRRLVERSRAIGPEHGQEHRSQPESLSSREGSPARTRTLNGTEGVLGPCDPAPVFPELAHTETGEDGPQPAGVIRIGMSERYHVETLSWQIPEKRRDDALAHVQAAIACGAAVEEQSRSFRRLDQDGVALAHVENRDAQPAIAWPHPGPRRDAYRDREAGDGRRS